MAFALRQYPASSRIYLTFVGSISETAFPFRVTVTVVRTSGFMCSQFFTYVRFSRYMSNPIIFLLCSLNLLCRVTSSDPTLIASNREGEQPPRMLQVSCSLPQDARPTDEYS